MILAAGGTGALGSVVVTTLLARGAPVRVLTRDARRAAEFAGRVEICVGDVRDAADVSRAVAGCSTVVSAVQGFAGTDPAGPDAVDHQGNAALIRAAAGAGVDHFILVSVHGAARRHPMELHRCKFRAEQELRASGLSATIVRPTAFMETWLATLQEPITSRGTAMVFGRGDNPINFVSVRDVAALVEQATRAPELRGSEIDIGGPADLTLNQFTAVLIGTRDIPIRHIPRPVMRVAAAALRPVRPALARLIHAGVVMDTTDMTLTPATRAALPDIPITALADLVGCRA